ncbi:MAG: hypothetical protein AAF289_05395 [Cyanobacteria bacterium P01_A01_bin.135]
MGKCNITGRELADALDVTEEGLADICDFFDSDPDDDWELVEGAHFKWGSHGARIFSPEGAVEICNYLEDNQQERPLLQRWKRWLLQRDRRLKGLMVAKHVQEISQLEGQVFFNGGRAFLGPGACREVLGLGKRQDILNRTFQEIQRSENIDIEPLKIDVDFFVGEQDTRCFSRSGLASVSKQLGVRLSQRHRQEWAKVVADYAPLAIEAIEQHEAGREKRIKQAMNRVRKRAGRRCQLTNRRQAIHRFDLEVHHLFDKNVYPQLADVETNLIAIASDIHTHFHMWMGGTHITCTVEDMERYVEEFSNSLFAEDSVAQATKVAMTLSNAKKSLRPLI